MRASFSRADGPARRRSFAASHPSRQEERHYADPIRAPLAGPPDWNADLDRRDVLRLGLLGGELTEQGVTGQVSTIDLTSFREATAVNCIAVYLRTQLPG
jgi:hypothetical protein